MISVLSRAEMRAFDRYAIETCQVPSLLLMENAGRGTADVILREVLERRTGEGVNGRDSQGPNVVVIAGTGNNGGDGFVVARHLLSRAPGTKVVTWLVGAVSRLTDDARVNHDALVGVGGKVIETSGENLDALEAALGTVDVIVDALFGTGLDRPVIGLHESVIALVNASKALRVAIDLPSGLDADTGASLGGCVSCDVTVTLGHLKLGLFTPQGAAHAGKVHVADLGVPPSIAEVASPSGSVAHLTEEGDLASWFSPRPLAAHKYSVGHVVVFGGSSGKIGAPLMVAHAALRGGAGAATIATWPEAANVIEARVTEVMTARIERDALPQSIGAALVGKRVAVVGPGLGLDNEARAAVVNLLSHFNGPVVVDADALTLFAKNVEAFADAKASLVLTPHSGELARLLDTTATAIESDRLMAVRAAAVRTQAIVVLKGTWTLIAAPDGRVVINPTGDPVLATAGAGDTLAGLLAAFACTMGLFEAACAAAYVHGLSAKLWRAVHAGVDRGLLASEIADGVPDVLARFRDARRGNDDADMQTRRHSTRKV